MQDIRLAAAAAHPPVGILRKHIGALDDLHLLAVIARKIGVENFPEGGVGHPVFFFGRHGTEFGHVTKLTNRIE